MRKVLVTQRLIHLPDLPEDRDALDVRWGTFLARVGLVPILVPSAGDLAAFLEAVQPVHGLLLTGGNDLSCVSNASIDRKRDQLEGDLCHWAETRDLPILGVCRGMQFLGVRSGFELAPVTGHRAQRHALTIEEDTDLFGSFAGLTVNSFHNYGLAGASSQMRIALRTSDGAAEAFVHREKKIAAMMWHPEREEPFRDEDLSVFRRFFT